MNNILKPAHLLKLFEEGCGEICIVKIIVLRAYLMQPAPCDARSPSFTFIG